MKNHTPAPWIWIELNGHKYLSTPDRGRLVIMDFVRKGLNAAEPRFSVWDGETRGRLGGIMRKASEIESIADHPDARLIQEAPALFEALQELVQELDDDEIETADWPAYDKAKKVLAKIRGESEATA